MQQIVLLKLEENFGAVPNPELAIMEPFKSLIKRDRGGAGDTQARKKSKAAKELAFIHLMVHPTSSFVKLYAHDEIIREKEIIKHLFGKKWEPDELVLECMEVYRKHVTHPIQELLVSAFAVVNKLKTFYDSIDFEVTDKNEKLVHDHKKVIDGLSRIGNVVTSLQKVEEEVKKEEATGIQTRGQTKITEFNN